MLTGEAALPEFLGSQILSFIFKASNAWLSPSHTANSLILLLLPPSFTFKDPGDNTESTAIIQDNRLISRLAAKQP